MLSQFFCKGVTCSNNINIESKAEKAAKVKWTGRENCICKYFLCRALPALHKIAFQISWFLDMKPPAVIGAFYMLFKIQYFVGSLDL